jgi:hypothetical protein
VVTRKKGHNPKSPEDDTKGVDLYMRLPHHRLRKVRETMYEDPGNPFGFESFENPPLPSTAYVEDAGWDIDDNGPWPLPGPEVVQTSLRAERDIVSVSSDPFDLVNVHTDRETRSSFGSNRRSMSVDIGFLPMQGMIEGRRPSDFETPWPLPIPTLHVQHPIGTLFTIHTKRDTKFYDFYDDLLAEYETEETKTGYTIRNKGYRSDCSNLCRVGIKLYHRTTSFKYITTKRCSRTVVDANEHISQ